MAGPWGKVGTWADDSEAEAAAAAAAATAPAAPPAPLPVEAFPSLGEAAAAKSSKKKSKGQTLSLSEFASGKYVGPGAKRSAASGIFNDSERLTSEEMMMLPTGPKDRSDEDPSEHLAGGRLGGGFRDYGGYRGGDRDRERDRDGRGGDRDRDQREQRGFGFDREREASRADDSNDWSMNKPSRGGGGGGGRFDDDRRYGGDRDRDRDLPSKADEVDNWAATKKFVPSDRRSDDFGRGGGLGKADSDDNWGASKRPVVSEKWSFNNRRPDESGPDADKWSRRGPGGEDDSPDRWSRKPSSDEPRRPRLNLQRRTLPVESSAPSGDSTQGSRPSSSHSSRPGTPETHVDTPPTVESKPRPNPFGNAKPREVLLEERGQDWRKIDLQLDSKRPDSEEEKKLKEEISSLKELAETVGDPAVKEQLAEKEQELEVLSREMDSKARVSVDRWRKGEEPRKPAASVQENEWRRGPDAWRRENGRDRPRW